MGLARSTSYYQPLGRQRADEKSVALRIEAICERWHAYGYRRVTSQLRREGHIVNHKRVARIMRERGLQGRSAASIVVTSDGAAVAPFPESRAWLRAERSQSALGCRSDLYPDCHRLCLPRRDPRRVVASCGRLRHRAARWTRGLRWRRCDQRSQVGSRPRGASIIPIEVRSTMPPPIASCSRLTSSPAR